MEILGSASDAVDIRFSTTEARALYNLLSESESWPYESMARPFIRQIREALSSALDAGAEGES